MGRGAARSPDDRAVGLSRTYAADAAAGGPIRTAGCSRRDTPTKRRTNRPVHPPQARHPSPMPDSWTDGVHSARAHTGSPSRHASTVTTHALQAHPLAGATRPSRGTPSVGRPVGLGAKPLPNGAPFNVTSGTHASPLLERSSPDRSMTTSKTAERSHSCDVLTEFSADATHVRGNTLATSTSSSVSDASGNPDDLDDLNAAGPIYAAAKRLRALWTVWSVEVRVLSGALAREGSRVTQTARDRAAELRLSPGVSGRAPAAHPPQHESVRPLGQRYEAREVIGEIHLGPHL